MSSVSTVHVLIMDPSSNEAEHLINLLRNYGFAVRATPIQTEQNLEESIESQSWDLFIAKPEVNDLSAFHALEMVQNYGRDIPFILMTYDYEPETHLKALKAGMRDVIPASEQELFCLVVERELKSLEDRRRRRSAELFLHETEKRNELLLDSSNEAIAYVHEGMHIYANKAYAELFGYEDSDDLECMPIMDMIAKDDHEAFKNYIKTHANNDSEEEFAFKGVCDDGANFDAIMTVSPAKYEGEDCTQLLIRTAGNSLELEQRLKELQAKDQLTGLYNQSFFVEKTQEQVNKYVEGSGQLVVTMAELDQFDELKNKFSLLEMDELIKQAGEVIADYFDEDTIIGRVGEDGFVVLNTYQNPNQAKEKGEALCGEFAKHMFEVKGQTFSITISVGMAVKQENSASGEEMVSNAHAACLRARSKGGNNVKSYNPAIDNAESTTNAQILEKLQDAMENERLLLTYQPIVKLHGEPQGLYQVALDIKDEKGESLPLDELFPAAQSAGMAVKLERWMVSKAISSLAQYRTSGLDAKIIIPLSSSSLLDDKFPHFILECVKRAQVPTANLIFQLTEDIAASHLKRSIAFSNALQKLKCKLAITGFGASQECENLLSHLKVSMATLLPNAVDFLMGTEEENNRVHELIDMIHNQSIVSVICNVEDAQALAVLWPLGVHYIQGSYLQEPMPEMGYDFSESDF